MWDLIIKQMNKQNRNRLVSTENRWWPERRGRGMGEIGEGD